MGIGTLAHLHPRHCHTCASIATRPPPFMLSCPGLVPSCPASFRSVLVPPCSVMDVPFGVVGGGRGAGSRGSARVVVVVKGSGWCEEGRMMMWQHPHLAIHSAFWARQLPKLKKMRCLRLIGPISVSISMIQISIWRAFYVYFECEVYFSGFLYFHSLFFIAFVKLTWFFDFLYQKRE